MVNLSLRARAVLGGVLWIALALGLSAYVLITIFDGIVERGFKRDIDERLVQVVRAYEAAPERMARQLVDPLYSSPGSGRYWQVNDARGGVWRSGSMQDFVLPDPGGDKRRIYAIKGPDSGVVQVHAVTLTMADGRTATAYAAETVKRLRADKVDFRRSLFGALVALGASLVLAGTAQTGMALSPLVTLRAAFWAFRSGEEERIRGRYPADIEPLVDDLNELLERNGRIIRRARRQVADLAHALKTPAAILRNELPQIEQGAAATEALDALNRMEAQMTRHMARARLAGGDSPHASAAPAEIVAGLSRVLERMRLERPITIVNDLPGDLRVRAEFQDTEELLGTLMENAVKWARKTVRVSAIRRLDLVEILIEDDGPGIPPEDRALALRPGGRLDEKKPGSGLGLAIASDIVEVYGGDLDLRLSRLGGLCVAAILPTASDSDDWLDRI